jgi:hypothetical protein
MVGRFQPSPRQHTYDTHQVHTDHKIMVSHHRQAAHLACRVLASPCEMGLCRASDRNACNPSFLLRSCWYFASSFDLGINVSKNLSSLTAQEKKFPLKKPAGFHWDFFLLGCTTIVAGLLGLPYPNGLVPQAPVHTDSLTTYEDEVEMIHTKEGEVLLNKKTVAKHVTEQRFSHLLMGLAIVGTMSKPLLTVLGTMPRALLSGVFFVVGWGSIERNGIIQKLIFLCTEERFIQPSDPLLKVPKRRILLFVFFQLLTWALSVGVSQTIAAIGFPIIVTALIPFRVYVIPKIFTREELEIMDALTATNEVVLASLGGRPVMREEMGRRNEEIVEDGLEQDDEGSRSEKEEGDSRNQLAGGRAGEIETRRRRKNGDA